MKKIILSSLLISSVFIGQAFAKDKKNVVVSSKILKTKRGIAWCSGYVVGVNVKMNCSGDIQGEATPYDLVHNGWKKITPISGANKFILIFTK
jgi:hypothetical protein